MPFGPNTLASPFDSPLHSAENLFLPIRPATLADLSALAAIEQSAPTAAHWSTDQYQSALSESGRVALVVEENAQILGFLIARAIIKEWEIENIVVCSPAWRRGLGIQLIDEFLALARAHHAEAIFLEVRASNLPARRLYEKRAFVECGRRRSYYRTPVEDAIVYRLILN